MNFKLPSARLVLVLTSVLSALAMVECGLRIASRSPLMLRDPIRGWSPRPGAGRWVFDENRVWVQINSDGLRDREHPLVKPPGTLRIAVLGDSVMQGINVPLEKAFHSYLEAELSRCLAPAGMGVEVINFGVSGYSTAQELLTFRDHASRYHPDVVMLAFFTENDIVDNSRALSSEPRPYFWYDGGRLTLDTAATERIAAREPFWRAWRIQATERSEALRLLYESVWVGARENWLQRGGDDEAVEGGDLYRPPEDADHLEAWRITEGLLHEVDTSVRAQGAEFWIVTLANAAQVDPDLAVRKRWHSRLGVPDLYYPDRRVQVFAEARDIPIIVLAPAMADYAAQHQTFLNGGYSSAAPPGAGHWNEVANQVAAGLVGARLCNHRLAGAP